MAAPRLALAEMLVWAAAFAHASNKQWWAEKDHAGVAAEAVKAAFNAVDLLRASQDLVARGNRKYEEQKVAFNAALERGIKAKDAPKVDEKETPEHAIEMLRAFLISDGKA